MFFPYHREGGPSIMSRKTAGAFCAGLVLGVAMALVFGLVASRAQAQESGPADGGATITDLTTALDQVRSDISDPDLREFYDKLVAGYGLTDTSGDAVPDIAGIQRTAITLPLQEAGRQIHDPDLAAFYQRFLADCGLTPQGAAR